MFRVRFAGRDRPMNATTTRRVAYRLAAVLAAAYVLDVLMHKYLSGAIPWVLGELGEFGVVLASVTAFSIGLLADEAVHNRDPH